MDSVLAFAKGPLFAVTFIFMILGLIRQVFLQIVQMKDVFPKSNYKDFSVYRNLKLFMKWMIPAQHVYRNKPVMGITSFVFRIGILIVPVFLLSHIDLWYRGIGLSWPGISLRVADVLTILTITAAAILFLFRLFDRSTRALTDGMDYLLLILVSIPFVTGFMAVHPSSNPVSYNAIMLIHILSSEAVFVILPYSKLVHAVLLPFDRMSSDIFWNMPVGAGEKVARKLPGKGAKI